MNKRDMVIGIVVLLFVAGIIYWLQRNRVDEMVKVPETNIQEVEDTLEEKFNVEIPEDVEKVELVDSSGGNASGVAVRKFENGVFSHTVLADLPKLGETKTYMSWLEDSNGEIVNVGILTIAKGGFVLDFTSTTDYMSYNKVFVTKETNSDSTPETKVLEGEF